MLFDLQSTRRRRNTVRGVYGLLAVLLAVGLIFLGVGSGNGGGVANSDNGGGSGGSSNASTYAAAVRSAEAGVKRSPDSAAAWNSLVQARWQEAGSGTNYDSSTDTYTTSGKAALSQMLVAYARYAALVKGTPAQSTAYQAAHANTVNGNYGASATAWQAFITTSPTAAKGYECLAFNAYAAKNTALATEAAARVLKLTPKLDQLSVQATLTSSKSSASTAGQYALANC